MAISCWCLLCFFVFLGFFLNFLLLVCCSCFEAQASSQFCLFIQQSCSVYSCFMKIQKNSFSSPVRIPVTFSTGLLHSRLGSSLDFIPLISVTTPIPPQSSHSFSYTWLQMQRENLNTPWFWHFGLCHSKQKLHFRQIIIESKYRPDARLSP